MPFSRSEPHPHSDRSSRPENSAADLLRVAGRLAAGSQTLRAAAVMLGLAEPQPAATPSPRPPAPPPATPRPPLARDRHPRWTGQVEDTVAEVRPAGDDHRTVRPARLDPVESPSTEPPRPAIRSVRDLFPPPATEPSRPPVPLFEPAHQRAVLSTLVSVDRAGNELDFDTLVERIATRQPIGQPPRLPAPTTRLGVQLLLDRRPAMDPFRHDQRMLTAALRLVVGVDLVEVLAVRGGLDRAVPLSGIRRKPVPYRPGLGPRAILLASDLGIARQATGRDTTWQADWERLAERATEAGAPLVVLNPYPPARWPGWAVRAMTVMHWDRSADAGQARQAARRAAAFARIRP
ncbi:MAG TPA: hypothetical protein VGP26_25650 [Actinophytocola sp.]|jgi:hypothetical protein|nr:hypothetical protein [Actinophytocola sp.]